MPIRRSLVLALLVALTSESSMAQPRSPFEPAQGLRYSAELEVAHSDNRARLNPKGPSDTLLTPRLGLTWFHFGSRLEARVAGEFEYLRSLDDQFADETRARASAQLDFALAPQRLYWTLQDYATMEPINIRDPAAPQNLQ